MTDARGEGAIRIVLADDQPIVRQGLKYMIDTQRDMKVVGEAGNGEEAVSVVLSARPDLVLMDIQMPIRSGIEATREITAQLPEAKIMLLTTFDVEQYVADGIRAGAIGYLLKDSETKVLLDGIRSVHQGAALYQSKTAAKAITQTLKQELPLYPEETSAEFEPLTEKEREVLQLLAYGKRNSEIAAALYISEGTVKTHVHRILAKLGVEDRTQAVVAALRRRIVK
jgi:DNA-binding NarL/FixJ family response regulator